MFKCTRVLHSRASTFSNLESRALLEAIAVDLIYHAYEQGCLTIAKVRLEHVTNLHVRLHCTQTF
jgi:hypothetical protein